MTRLFLLAALLASATTASASVVYSFHSHSNSFGDTDWQFTAPSFLNAPGTTYITTFDSYSSSFLGGILFDVRMIDPFSASPFISTDTDNGALSSGGWVGPFDHAGIYSTRDATLTISSTSQPAPEPSTPALIVAGAVLLAVVHRRRWALHQQTPR